MITFCLSIFLTVIVGVGWELKRRREKKVDHAIIAMVICVYTVVGTILGLALYGGLGVIFGNCSRLLCGPLW